MALRVRGRRWPRSHGAAPPHARAHDLRRGSGRDASISSSAPAATAHNTYNVSTCAALRRARARALRVAKHGNRSRLLALGCLRDVLSAPRRRDRRPGRKSVARSLSRGRASASCGRPMHHPAFKAWAPVRRRSRRAAPCSTCSGRSAIRPGVKRQIVGVFDERWVEPVAEVLRNLGTEWRLGRARPRRVSMSCPRQGLPLVAELAQRPGAHLRSRPTRRSACSPPRSPTSEAVTPRPTPRLCVPCWRASPAPIATSCCSIPARPCWSAARRRILPMASCGRGLHRQRGAASASPHRALQRPIEG